MLWQQTTGVCCHSHTKHIKQFVWAKRRVFRPVRKIAKSNHYFRHVCPSAWTRIFMKFNIWLFFFRKTVKKIQASLKSDNNNRYLTCGPIQIFFIISLSVLLIMRNISDKICRENQNTHFVFSNFLFPKIVPFMKYDMIYLLTAFGLSPGGSTHLHTNNNRTTQITTEQHK
jgi:hypothetical protein